MRWLWMAFVLMRNLFRDRGELALENLALRRQLAVLQGSKKRPRIRHGVRCGCTRSSSSSGDEVSETTADKYMVRSPKPPSQTWRTFLGNHLSDTVGVDIFTMPTATFGILYTFIVPCHDRRRVMHFNVTEHATAEWAAQSRRAGIEAFSDDEVPRFLIRDRDSIYGHHFKNRIKNMGIEQVVTAAR